MITKTRLIQETSAFDFHGRKANTILVHCFFLAFSSNEKHSRISLNGSHKTSYIVTFLLLGLQLPSLAPIFVNQISLAIS